MFKIPRRWYFVEAHLTVQHQHLDTGSFFHSTKLHMLNQIGQGGSVDIFKILHSFTIGLKSGPGLCHLRTL